MSGLEKKRIKSEAKAIWYLNDESNYENGILNIRRNIKTFDSKNKLGCSDAELTNRIFNLIVLVSNTKSQK